MASSSSRSPDTQKAAVAAGKLVECFRRCDANQDGKISRVELFVVLRKIDSEGSISESDVSRVLDTVDRNGDGYIDYNEFVLWVEGDPCSARALLTAAECFDVQPNTDLPLQNFGDMRLESAKGGGVTAMNRAGSEYGGLGHGIAISKAELNTDKPHFVCTIDRSRDNDGEGIYIGVAKIDEASLSSGTPRGRCWVLLLSTGQVWQGSGNLIDPIFESTTATIFNDTTFEAGGSDITVLVDFAKGSLSFSLNDSEFLDSSANLSSTLRAYVHSTYLDDAITVYM